MMVAADLTEEHLDFLTGCLDKSGWHECCSYVCRAFENRWK